ncbi:Chlorovirus glycoprotein repeat domain-containing protein [Acanthocystis turfacea Chlorella virus NTS-1]|nr:Chlorovirus glycoprotein repeat domain-containing protein [Acanthocystis turfacea Chlorella virus NTS-1]
MSYFLTPWEYRFNDIVAYGNVDVSGQVNVVGNVYADYIFGNVQGNVISQLPSVGLLDVRGNIIGTYANMSQIISTVGNIANVRFAQDGNVTASYYFGNGSQLTGITSTLPRTANLDILNGNITGSFANVSNIIATFGNIANVRFARDGNVTASYYFGNGSQLTGITSTLPGTANLDILNGNITGSYANVSNIIATFGNIANVRFAQDGNVAVSGQVNVLGNVVSPFFIGNGSQLTGITLPGTARLDILYGNFTGVTVTVSNLYVSSYTNLSGVSFGSGNMDMGGGTLFGGNIFGSVANVSNINATFGNIANVRFARDGNVTASYYFGNGSQLTGITLPGTANLDIPNGNITGSFANVSNIIAAAGNIANVRFLGGNVSVSGQVNISGNMVASNGVMSSMYLSTGVNANNMIFLSSAGGANDNSVFSMGLSGTGASTQMRFGTGAGSLGYIFTQTIPGLSTQIELANINYFGGAAFTSNTAGALGARIIQGSTGFTGSMLYTETLTPSTGSFSHIRCTSGGLNATGSDVFRVNAGGNVSANAITLLGNINTTNNTAITLSGTSSILSFINLGSGADLGNVSNQGWNFRNPTSTTCTAQIVSVNTGYVSDILRTESARSTSFGSYNHIVCTGSGSGNVFRVQGNGRTYTLGGTVTTGADYAEMFQWDKVPSEDTRGKTVVLSGKFIRLSTPEDDPLDIFGIVSTMPSVVGDAHWSYWKDKYRNDKFGNQILEPVQYVSNIADDTDRVVYDGTSVVADGYEIITEKRPILNPAFDPSLQYIPREARPEWAPIGLVGKLRVLPGQVVNPAWQLLRTISAPDGEVLEYCLSTASAGMKTIRDKMTTLEDTVKVLQQQNELLMKALNIPM